MGHVRPRPIHAVLQSNFKIFSLPFDIDWRNNITTKVGTHWSSVFRRFKVKYLTCHILNSYKNYVLPSEWFPNLITYIQQVVNMFGITYHWTGVLTQIWMQRTPGMLCLQLSYHHLYDGLLTKATGWGLLSILRCHTNKLWWYLEVWLGSSGFVIMMLQPWNHKLKLLSTKALLVTCLFNYFFFYKTTWL